MQRSEHIWFCSCLKIWFDVLEVSRQYLRVSTATRHCAEHKDRVEGEQHSRRASTQAPLLYGNLQVKYRYHHKAAQPTSKTTRAKAPLCSKFTGQNPTPRKKRHKRRQQKQHVKTPFYTVIYRKNADTKKKAAQATQKKAAQVTQKKASQANASPLAHLGAMLPHLGGYVGPSGGLC